MKTLVIIAALFGTYEVTQKHESVRGEWVKTTVEAGSVAEAVEKTQEYAFYKITKVEEVEPVPKVSEIEAVVKAAKDLDVALRRYQTKRNNAGMAPASKAEKVQADLATDAHHLDVLESALHAACVDAGVADARDPSEYEERSWWLSQFHEQRWKPATPKKLRAIPKDEYDAAMEDHRRSQDLGPIGGGG